MDFYLHFQILTYGYDELSTYRFVDTIHLHSRVRIQPTNLFADTLYISTYLLSILSPY